ncbi:MAG: aldo/keto reductase [Acidobacteria bacterium]|nr:aldo/keto reductase [Acidobacteriota bacterium]
MAGYKDPFMSRKEFLKKTSAAVMGMGLAARNPSESNASESKTAALTPKPLGRTGIRITPIGFGATRTMEPLLMLAVLDAGINLFDTGPSYFGGRNEILVGEIISGRRANVVVQSKLQLDIRGDGKSEPSSAEISRMTGAMAKSLEGSLKAMRTDYIDIMLIHNATSPTLSHHEAVREFFTAAKKSGKIRAHGFSAHTNHVEMLAAAMKAKFYDVIMVPYNHKGSYVHSNSGRFSAWDQSALENEMKTAMDSGMGLIAMKTCSGGPCPPQEGGKPDFEHALRWILRRNKVHGLAVAMGNFQQLKEALNALA